MNRILILLAFLPFIGNAPLQAQGNPEIEYLTLETFKEKVFNFEKNPEEWVYEGKLPCIIDFYADWCKPCKLIAPIMEELAQEYKGKIKIYKVDTEQQRELSSLFGIRSIPSVLFCPMEGKPQMATGAHLKETYKDAIENFLLKQ
ncbi:MAG: thiol reductase thioredoxin [Bacteroidales bacterium]|nr:thiol reductase thioredoxin [Bacteroidales bacterium]